MSVKKVLSITEPMPVLSSTECNHIFVCLMHITFIMIFKWPWCKSSKRNISVSEHWFNNSKEKPKDICDNNKDLTEYHKNDVKMKELPLERN